MKNLEQLLMIWHQSLHQIPEKGLQEYKTAAYIREVLTTLGISYQSILETGTLVYFDYGCEETIAFRADIDGLPMLEATNVSFASKHENMMHACGHDGHTAIMLGVAHELQALTTTFKRNILLIFQPAEEDPGGAELIVKTGILQQYNVKAIFGLHLFPDLPEHLLASKEGALMAQGVVAYVKIIGKSAHAALPQAGIDAIAIAAQVITAYKQIQTRVCDPLEPTILNIGTISGGDATNIVANEVQLGISMRSYSNAVMQAMLEAMHQVNEGMEAMYGCQVELHIQPGYQAVLNDSSLYQTFTTALNHSGLTYQPLSQPYMTSEDFSTYQQEIPGVFFFLGTRNEEKGFIYGLHNNQFNFDETVLATGVKAFLALANHYCFEESTQ